MNTKLKIWLAWCDVCLYQSVGRGSQTPCKACKYGDPPTKYFNGICEGCEVEVKTKPYNFDGIKICEDCFELLNSTIL